MARKLRRWWIALAAAAVVVGAGITVPVVRASAESCGTGDDSCPLAFVAQPGNAVVNSNITSQGFKATGTPFSVQASDGDSDGDVTVSGLTVTLSLLPLSSTATLTAPTGTTDSTGTATFASPVSINQTGYYQLEASSPGFISATSTVFYIAGNVSPCTGKSCSDTVTSPNSSSTSVVVNAAGDFLSMGAGGLDYSCPGYTPVSGIIATDVWQSDGNSISTTNARTTITIPKAIVMLSPNNGAAFYQVCYASTVSFTPRGGGSPTQVTVQGITFYVGLLPDCSLPAPAPCVTARHKIHGGQVVISFLGLGDFYGQM